jgi:hypothetical protein
MAGIDNKMAGIATYLPHFFLDSGISTWTIFYGTRTTTTTTSLNHLYIQADRAFGTFRDRVSDG